MSTVSHNGPVSDREIVEMALAMVGAGASHREVGEILGMSAMEVGRKLAADAFYKGRTFHKTAATSRRGMRTKGTVADLNEVIRSVMADEELADPHVIAAHVLKRIAPKDREYALQLCLPTQVQRVIRGMRQNARRTDKPDPTANGRRDATVAEMDTMSAHFVFDVDALGLRDHLSDRVSVAGEWKLLRDCTYVDLHELAAQYRARAEGQLGVADFYESLAEALERAGGGELTVGEAAS